jgi:hypothetical protein
MLDFYLLCSDSTAEMGRILLATGYDDCFAGITFAQSIALNMAEEYEESEKYLCFCFCFLFFLFFCFLFF